MVFLFRVFAENTEQIGVCVQTGEMSLIQELYEWFGKLCHKNQL